MNALVYRFVTILVTALVMCTTGCGGTAVTQVPTVEPIVPTATPVPTAAPTLESGDVERTLTVDGLERLYLLHIPPGLDSVEPAPVVFVFHPLGGSISDIQLTTDFDTVADNGKFVLVYPEGISESWNAGVKCCGYAAANNLDDVAFVRQILADMETVVNIDPQRIYATGFSNGAFFSYRLACEMSEVFAAIAPVAGVMIVSPCEPQQSVSVLHVHGIDDQIVPYEGDLDFPSVEEAITTWLELNGCTGSPTVDNPIPTIKHTAYTSCQSGTAVELYAAEGGGHAWISKYVYPISGVIWEFFAAHPKP